MAPDSPLHGATTGSEWRAQRRWLTAVLGLLLAVFVGATLGGTRDATYAAFSDFDTYGNLAGAGVWDSELPVPPQCQGMKFKNVILGTPDDDTLVGTRHADLVFGFGGNDFIGGSDVVNGNNGKDCLVGGAGNDVLAGSNAKDVLIGGTGDDVLDGSNGPDKIFGGDGFDFCDGGLAPDVIEECEDGPGLSTFASTFESMTTDESDPAIDGETTVEEESSESSDVSDPVTNEEIVVDEELSSTDSEEIVSEGETDAAEEASTGVEQ